MEINTFCFIFLPCSFFVRLNGWRWTAQSAFSCVCYTWDSRGQQEMHSIPAAEVLEGIISAGEQQDLNLGEILVIDPPISPCTGFSWDWPLCSVGSQVISWSCTLSGDLCHQCVNGPFLFCWAEQEQLFCQRKGCFTGGSLFAKVVAELSLSCASMEDGAAAISTKCVSVNCSRIRGFLPMRCFFSFAKQTETSVTI